jgi:glutaryl-CoA dehydrogenase
MSKSTKATFSWSDPFQLDARLTDDERQVQEAAPAYWQAKLLPRVTEAFRHSILPG